MAAFPLPDGGTRLFLPSRAEGDPLQVVDVSGTQMSCTFNPQDNNCFDSALGLAFNARMPNDPGVPAAPNPFGIGISKDGVDLYVTHLAQADAPPGTGLNPHAYVVHMSPLSPPVPASPTSNGIPDDDFIDIGDTGAFSVAVGSRYAFLAGIAAPPVTLPNVPEDVLLRLVDRTNHVVVQNAGLRSSYHALTARGIALSSDEQKLYLATRTPDSLLIVDVVGPTTDTPSFNIERIVALPPGGGQVHVIPRPGMGDLVAVLCPESSDLVLYDVEHNSPVTVPSIGASPFDLAVDTTTKPGAARLYITNHSDGRVAVVDIPDLTTPQNPQLIAHIGKLQTCIVNPADPSCGG
jgi:hypothetical protein